jgi:hypothetical protein
MSEARNAYSCLQATEGPNGEPKNPLVTETTVRPDVSVMPCPTAPQSDPEPLA